MIYLCENCFHVSLMNLRSLLLEDCVYVIVFLTIFFHRRSSLMTGVESQRSHQTQRRSTNERGTWWSPLTASGSLTGWPRISTTHAWTKRRLKSWGWNPSKTYWMSLGGGQYWLSRGKTQNSGEETKLTQLSNLNQHSFTVIWRNSHTGKVHRFDRWLLDWTKARKSCLPKIAKAAAILKIGPIMWTTLAVWSSAGLVTKGRQLIHWFVQSKNHQSNLWTLPA